MEKQPYKKPKLKMLCLDNEELMGPGASITPPDVGAKEMMMEEESATQQQQPTFHSVWEQ